MKVFQILLGGRVHRLVLVEADNEDDAKRLAEEGEGEIQDLSDHLEALEATEFTPAQVQYILERYTRREAARKAMRDRVEKAAPAMVAHMYDLSLIHTRHSETSLQSILTSDPAKDDPQYQGFVLSWDLIMNVALRADRRKASRQGIQTIPQSKTPSEEEWAVLTEAITSDPSQNQNQKLSRKARQLRRCHSLLLTLVFRSTDRQTMPPKVAARQIKTIMAKH